MAKDNTTRGTRLPDEMDADFEAYRDANEMNNSEALRELVGTGLDEKRNDEFAERPDSWVAGLLWDARNEIHTFVFVTLVAYLLSTLTAGLMSTGFEVVAFLYALTFLVGVADGLLNHPLARHVADVDTDAGPNEVEA